MAERAGFDSHLTENVYTEQIHGNRAVTRRPHLGLPRVDRTRMRARKHHRNPNHKLALPGPYSLFGIIVCASTHHKGILAPFGPA